jgi:hypothetical protein
LRGEHYRKRYGQSPGEMVDQGVATGDPEHIEATESVN